MVRTEQVLPNVLRSALSRLTVIATIAVMFLSCPFPSLASTPVVVTITPSAATVFAGKTVTLKATVTGSAITGVSWSATCGTLPASPTNTLLLTAPVTPGSCTVTATSHADATKQAQATVTVVPNVVVTVTPATATVAAGGSGSFTATVTNTSNVAVKWTASCGTLADATANPVSYMAPAAGGTCTLKATSQAETTQSGTAKVTVTPPPTVSISPKTLELASGLSATFTAKLTNSTSNAVTFAASCGSLSNVTATTVKYTAPTGTTSCTVTATGVADTTKMATATVTVPGPVAVSVSPATVSMAVNGTTTLTATVANTTNQAVLWKTSCGTLSSTTANPVAFTAPAATGSCKVTATSRADATKSGNAVVTVGAANVVGIAISPASISVAPGATVHFTATVTGASNQAVTWSADDGTIVGNGNTIAYTNSDQGISHVTATAVADASQTALADVLVLPAGQTYPAVPYPVTTHPRIWLTQADLPRLQSWATSANPIYEQGLLPQLQQAVSLYQTQFFPGGQPNPNYPDPGDVQGYTGYLTEEWAVVLAFHSLIDPNPANRITYAQYARNLIMYAMNQAALGQQPNAPFRDPAFPIYNRAGLSSPEWPLVVDWIYNAKDAGGKDILTAADKATIRNVFLIWAADCINASTTGGDSPYPQGVINDLQLLPNNQPYRMAANNYYLGHARLLTMMALTMDPSDDPPVDASQPSSQLGNTLRSYLNDANGAWLYQEYAMFGDAKTVATEYNIPDNSNGVGFGLASGGLPPEGMLYGESFGTMLGQLLALETAGFNDPSLSGPQIGLVSAPMWDKYVTGMLSSLIPQSFVPASEPYIGSVYQFASYGDLLRLWVEPDNVGSFAMLGLVDANNGQTNRQAELRWFARDVLPGGAAGLTGRVTNPWTTLDSLLYYLMFDPTVAADPDPRPGYPTNFYDPGAGRLVAHSDWSANQTMFDYHASWESINHQVGNAGEFEMFRKGEWLTKEMSNYDNNLVGMTTYYHNSLALKNTCPAGTPSLGWDETGIWANGSQFLWAENAGDPTTLSSSGTGYVFAATDMTNLYNRPDQWDSTQSAVDITRAQRNILWLNKDYIVVYDRATSKSSGLFKRFNMSLVTNPVINGMNATETMTDGQQLFVHTLLPANAQITAREADTDLSPIADLEPTKYVMTVGDASNPMDTRFLHVIQGADKGAVATSVSSLSSTGGTAFEGALVGTTAVMFLHDDTQLSGFAQTTFTEPAAVTKNYVAGLLPGAGYTVAKTTTGGNTQVTVTVGGATVADSAGLLVF